MIAQVAASVAAGAAMLGFAAWRRHIWAARACTVTADGKPVTTEWAAFDEEAHGSDISWDAHSVRVRGKRVVLCGGEFHYWRLPDPSEWERVLTQYRALGWNCVRIYFHWGMHAPSQKGVELSDGRRDIEKLLQICERVGLWVLAAPGPYICAETQAGGLPAWLVQDRAVRLRHSVTSGWRRFDARYNDACDTWLDALLPILAAHQITTRPDGCVLAVQLENESFEAVPLQNVLPRWLGWLAQCIYLPFGLCDDMRRLAVTARRAGITVPLFTNDAWDAGSFMVAPRGPSGSFGLDLYGFDQYLVFAPEPLEKNLRADYWALESAVAPLESRVRTLMNRAGAHSPIFIPELQGGWFSGYALAHNYDGVDRFYGPEYTRELVLLMLAQGVTAWSLYMGYGGTNWGTLGDPDVFSSYDYSACLREYRVPGSRGRLVRLANLHVRTFAALWAATERGSVGASEAKVVVAVRRCLDVAGASLALVRPTRVVEAADGTVTVDVVRGKVSTSLKVAHCAPYPMFVSLRNVPVDEAGTLRVLLAFLAVHARIPLGDGTVAWIVQTQAAAPRELFLSLQVSVKSSKGLGATAAAVPEIPGATRVTLQGAEGWCLLGGSGAGPQLLLVALADASLATLHGGRVGSALSETSADPCDLDHVAWGVENVTLTTAAKPGTVLARVEHAPAQKTAHILAKKALKVVAAEKSSSGPWEKCPLLQHLAVEPWTPSVAPCLLEDWQEAPLELETQFDSTLNSAGALCKELPQDSTFLEWDAITWAAIGGHVLYRAQFHVAASCDAVAALKPRTVQLSVNPRHRASIWCNGRFVGGHTVYSRSVIVPGGHVGPDPAGFCRSRLWRSRQFLGTRTFDLTDAVAHGERVRVPRTEFDPRASDRDLVDAHRCEIFVLVDSFGLNRQAFFLNDARNPRGLLFAAVYGARCGLRDGAVSSHIRWSLAGVDVTQRSEPYATCGLPGETAALAGKLPWSSIGPARAPHLPALGSTAKVPQNRAAGYEISPHSGPTWLRAQFRCASKETIRPLRLHLQGVCTAYIWINGTLVGRYYGNGDAPQHDFYLPDGLLRHESPNQLLLLAYSWEWTLFTAAVVPWIVDEHGNLCDASGEVSGDALARAVVELRLS